MEKKSIFKRIDELYTKVTKTIIGDIPLDTDPQRSTHKSTTTVKKTETIKEKLASAKKKFLNLGKPNDEQRLLYKEVIKRESEEAKEALKIEQEAKKSVTTAKKEAKESAKKKLSNKKTVTKSTSIKSTAKKPTVKKTTTKTTTNSKTTAKPVTKKKSTTTTNVKAATKKATVKKPAEKKVTTKKTISKAAKSKITTAKKPAVQVTAKSENSKATTKPTKIKTDEVTKSIKKKPTTKKATVKKSAEKKVTTKKTNLTNKTKSMPRGSKKAEKIALYIEDIKKNYGEVDEDFVAIVVKNLGPSIYKADAELVSCSDPKELDTVRKNFLMKKLGIDASQSVLDAAIQDVCAELKDVRRKYRATFYYALAKKFKKESVLS